MSKQLEATITCPMCGHKFYTKLFRSIWIEDHRNRDLIFSDKINVVTCPKCKETTNLNYPFLATNIKKNIAVWYEPYHDAQIDIDIEQYAQHFGRNSFYAKAPRISNWEEFKKVLLSFEGNMPDNNTDAIPSKELQHDINGFVKHISGTKTNKKVTSDYLARLILEVMSKCISFVYITAPLASIVSFIGIFLGLGGWGWALFIYFGFIGMFSLAASKQIRDCLQSSSHVSSGLLSGYLCMGIVHVILFVLGIWFALSGLPQRLPISYLIGLTTWAAIIFVLYVIISGLLKHKY